MDAEFLTATEVAQRLHVTSISVAKWIRLGHFPNAYKINPRLRKSAWRIPKADLDAFIAQRRQERGFIYLPPVL